MSIKSEHILADAIEAALPDDEIVCEKCKKVHEQGDCIPAREIGAGVRGYICWSCAAGIR